MRILWMSISLVTAVLIAAVVLTRSPRLMLIQHGTPEVPGGHAFAIMNPFRNRRPEEVAEKLITDLHSGRCEQILHDLHSGDPRLCPILQKNTNARLIWRKDGGSVRVLVYDLPKSKSRLWITSTHSNVGSVVTGVSLIQ